MKKVWLLFQGTKVIGAFSTLKKAEAAAGIAQVQAGPDVMFGIVSQVVQ